MAQRGLPDLIVREGKKQSQKYRAQISQEKKKSLTLHVIGVLIRVDGIVRACTHELIYIYKEYIIDIDIGRYLFDLYFDSGAKLSPRIRIRNHGLIQKSR
mgnify:CR=1 FL=1